MAGDICRTGDASFDDDFKFLEPDINFPRGDIDVRMLHEHYAPTIIEVSKIKKPITSKEVI